MTVTVLNEAAAGRRTEGGGTPAPGGQGGEYTLDGRSLIEIVDLWEFIRGVGVRRADGSTPAGVTGTANGPWTVPKSAMPATATHWIAVLVGGGGCGGAGTTGFDDGTPTAINGGNGAAGVELHNVSDVTDGTNALVVTVGAGGLAGNANVNLRNGGSTFITRSTSGPTYGARGGPSGEDAVGLTSGAAGGFGALVTYVDLPLQASNTGTELALATPRGDFYPAAMFSAPLRPAWAAYRRNTPIASPPAATVRTLSGAVVGQAGAGGPGNDTGAASPGTNGGPGYARIEWVRLEARA